MDVANYNERVMNGAHMESVADLAIRTALATRGVSHITIPVDVQVQEIKKGRSERNPVHHTSSVPAFSEHQPALIDLEHAADILNRGKKIAIIEGQEPSMRREDLAIAEKRKGAVDGAVLSEDWFCPPLLFHQSC
ncbi:MAG TPA: hypothetical protein VK638_08965 [Edaphobacter sp.]|nr:hypothetical protein [Edaphobacter sp.]